MGNAFGVGRLSLGGGRGEGCQRLSKTTCQRSLPLSPPKGARRRAVWMDLGVKIDHDQADYQHDVLYSLCRKPVIDAITWTSPNRLV